MTQRNPDARIPTSSLAGAAPLLIPAAGFSAPQPDAPAHATAPPAAAVMPPETPVPRLQPVVFAAAAGAPPAPAVRIFLGTERAQHRAERVFFHSLAQVRDPQRRYEVYRMIDLPGFDQRHWRTHFTNYRFAIPDLAGRQGRALYNDVDQIFTGDPAPLFDQDMGAHGYLALSPADTAVMLIDCARMAECWNYDSACRRPKKALLAEAAAVPGRWGPLAPAWHARDLEYRHGESQLLHYTTLHLQPWRPTPAQYSYQIHPYAEHFLGLEQAADAAGFETYTAACPSPAFRDVAVDGDALWPVDRLFAERLGCRSWGLVGAWDASGLSGVEHWRPARLREPDLPPVDALALRGLERLPAEDRPWLLHAAAARARRLLQVEAQLDDSPWETGSVEGWRRLMRRVAARHPQLSWRLELTDAHGHRQAWQCERATETVGEPRVWLLLGRHAGDNAQLRAIAEALGWSYQCHSLGLPGQGRISRRQRARACARLSPPWPDLVLSAGRRTAAVARWIKAHSQGRTRLVVVGRPHAPYEAFDLLLTTPQYGLPLRDRVIDLPVPFATPPTVSERVLDLWRARLAHLPRPWVVLLAGGDSRPYVFDAATARALGEQASAAVAARGGSLLLSTSPRTPAAAADALEAALRVPHWCYRYDPVGDNPYAALLALGDAFIVTGESVSMLTEASLTGRPVAVAPLPTRRGLKARLLQAVERRLGVIDRVAGSRGTPRQQIRAGRLYDALLVRGWLNRERRMEEVHLALGVQPLPEGLARPATLTPAQIGLAQARALAAIRALVEERAVPPTKA